jgi:hypothetical protein
VTGRLAPPTAVTTRHSASLYPWQIGSTLPADGPVVGLDLLAGRTVFHYDPWVLYSRRLLTSPNMVVLGQLGKGKSSLVKTHLHRQLLHGRQVYVLDPKGEYGPLARLHNLPLLRLGPGSPDRLNPLEPLPGEDSAALQLRRTQTCAALASAGLGRDLDPEQRAALTGTVAALPAGALLGHVVDGLLRPSQHIATELHTSTAELAARARPVALELRRLLHGDLAGLLDAPTTTRLGPSGRGLVLDLSAVFGSPALPAVMVAAGAWLSRALTHTTATSDRGAGDEGQERRRVLLVDEAWVLLHLPATTAWLQALSKLARAHGVQLVTVLHRASDLAGQADDGTATQARARGLLADAETRVLYTQSPGERPLLRELLDLTDVELDLLIQLPPHRALWQIGRHRAVVQHLLSLREAAELIDTDQHMRPGRTSKHPDPVAAPPTGHGAGTPTDAGACTPTGATP